MINKKTNPMTAKELQAYSGKNGEYYSRFLTRHQHATTFLSWNWSAFFFLPFWLAYRKLWKPFLAIAGLQTLIVTLTFNVSSMLTGRLPYFELLLLTGGLCLASIIGIGIVLLANSFYLQKAEKAIQHANLQGTNSYHKKGRSILALIVTIAVFTIFSGYQQWSLTHKYILSERQGQIAYDAQTEAPTNTPTDIQALETALRDIRYYSDEDIEKIFMLLKPLDDISELSNSSSIEQLLGYVITEQDIDLLQILIDKKLNLKQTENYLNVSFLEFAHDNNHWAIARFLIDKAGYEVDSSYLMKPKGYNEKRPLQYVVEKGDLESVRWMLEKDVPVQAKFYKDDSPLILAVKAKKPDIIKLLLSSGANPNNKNANYNSATSLALNSDNPAITALFSDKITKDTFSTTALNNAINNDIALAKKMIDSGMDLNKKEKTFGSGSYPLFTAIKNIDNDREDQSELVRYLIEKGANINQLEDDGTFPMYYIIEHANGTNLMAYATDNGSKLDGKVYGMNLLGVAFNALSSGENYLDKVHFLIEQGMSLTDIMNSNEELPLHRAINTQNQALIEKIMSNMTSKNEQEYFNAQDSDGNTPLHYAAAIGDEATISKLLNANVDTTIKDNLLGLQAIGFAANEATITILQKTMNKDTHSVNNAYCNLYVKELADKSKQNHCLESAKAYIQKNNRVSALSHYFLAGAVDKIIELGKDTKWIEDCRCVHAYIYVANAHILQGNIEKAKELYTKALKETYFRNQLDEFIKGEIKIMDKLNTEFAIKAKTIWEELNQ